MDNKSKQSWRAYALDEAKRIITSDRNEQYGEPEDNFAVIASFWSLWLTARQDKDITVTAYDVAQMMSLFKKGRAATAKLHKSDTLVDDLGYTACAEEIAADGMDKPVDGIDGRQHGYWRIAEYAYFTCSVCGCDYYNGAESTNEAKQMLANGKAYEYCPHCGAVMGLEVTTDEN